MGRAMGYQVMLVVSRALRFMAASVAARAPMSSVPSAAAVASTSAAKLASMCYRSGRSAGGCGGGCRRDLLVGAGAGLVTPEAQGWTALSRTRLA